MYPSRNAYSEPRMINPRPARSGLPLWLVAATLLFVFWALISSVLAEELAAGLPSNAFIDLVVVDVLTAIGDWLRHQAGQLTTTLRSL